MRKLHFGIFISAILVAVGTSVSAQTTVPKNEIEIRGIYAVPSGEVDFSGTTGAGNTVSFDNDFDLKNKLGFGLRYTYRSENGKHKLMAGYHRTATSNTRLLSRTFVFQGQTYTANLNTRAEDSLGLFLAPYVYRWGNKKVRIGPMGQVGWATTRVGLTAVSNTAIAAREGSITALAGTFTAIAERRARRVSLRGSGAACSPFRSSPTRRAPACQSRKQPGAECLPVLLPRRPDRADRKRLSSCVRGRRGAGS